MSGVKVTAFVAALVCALSEVSIANVLSSGTCNTSKYNVVSVNYDENVKLINWDVIYATDVDPFKSMNTFAVLMTNNGDGSYDESDTITYQDSSSNSQKYTQTYVQNVITQDGTDASSDQTQHFKLYPLAVSDENGILYLRCSEVGGMDADTRFIAVPKGTTLSDAGLKKLMDADASYGFKGALYKLPNSGS